jgi:hypothetical protein
VGSILTAYPNARNNPAGAMPVYLVAPPINPPWPNNQGNAGAAIPMNFVAQGASPNSGPIPVRIVAGPGPGPIYGNDQGIDANAIPVFDDAAGMPVWIASGTPPGLVPVNTTLPSITPTDIQISGTILTMDPGVWTNNPTSYRYQWTRNGANIGINSSTYTTVLADRNTDIGGNVVAETASTESLPAASSNVVSIMGVPVNIIPPSISPIGPVDVGTGLLINNGTWTNNPAGFYYTWRRDGNTISGATMNVYLTVDADANTIIDSVMLATNAAGSGNALPTSNQVAINSLEPMITPAVFNISLPVINGQVVGTIVATGSPNAWALVETGGTPSGVFTISNSGVVTVSNASLVASGAYTYTVYAQSDIGIGEPSTCTINVT